MYPNITGSLKDWKKPDRTNENLQEIILSQGLRIEVSSVFCRVKAHMSY